jgi:hypothetical protein
MFYLLYEIPVAFITLLQNTSGSFQLPGKFTENAENLEI